RRIGFLFGAPHADLAWKALSTGRNLRWVRYELFLVFRDRRARRTLFVRRSRTGNTHRFAGKHCALLAWVSPKRPPRPALWVPRSRQVGAGERPLVQPVQGAARSLRESRGRLVGLERSGFSLPLR